MRKPTENSTALIGINHDIKTLTNGVLCMSSLLENTALNVEQAEIVQLLRKSAADLNAMMSQILATSQAQNSVPVSKIEAFNLKEEVEYIFNTFKLTMVKKPIETTLIIDKSVPATVKSDRSALNRILNNLLHNAGKFTESGSIELRIKTGQIGEEKQTIFFDITDTGVGISTKNIKKVFNNFTKFNSEGYGIGLATVKELVESLEGNIEVESALNIGTKFIVSIPFEVTEFAANKKTIPLNSKVLKDKKILIADDDVVYKKYLSSILSPFNADITFVNSGEEVLQRIDNQRFDLILLDLNLSGIDGFTTASEIRFTKNKNTHTPIVGMSAGEAQEKKVRACGMVDMLPKPLNTEGLTFRLQRVLEGQKGFFVQNISKNKLHITNFNFDKKLNGTHLATLYGNDMEHASLIFETFLTESLPDFYTIFDALKAENYADIKSKAHRFKAAFSMVGLTQIEKQLTDLERNIYNYSQHKISEILKNMDVKITHFKPILNRELERLKAAYTLKAA
jgi:CheY-like chemotaxis protein/two-component sensor histidine kinase/HPt (histidine-containing phosphotransfer) domain-containing protein